MGIGAFESREYIRQLGGDISVESEPGVGSCFRVTLPQSGEADPQSHPIDGAQPATNTE